MCLLNTLRSFKQNLEVKRFTHIMEKCLQDLAVELADNKSLTRAERTDKRAKIAFNRNVLNLVWHNYMTFTCDEAAQQVTWWGKM